jgi:hypothetical protein
VMSRDIAMAWVHAVGPGHLLSGAKLHELAGRCTARS